MAMDWKDIEGILNFAVNDKNENYTIISNCQLTFMVHRLLNQLFVSGPTNNAKHTTQNEKRFAKCQ